MISLFVTSRVFLLALGAWMSGIQLLEAAGSQIFCSLLERQGGNDGRNGVEGRKGMKVEG